MTLIDLLVRLLGVIEALPRLTQQVAKIGAVVAQVLPRRPTAAYENLFLDLTFDIQDRQGMRAVLRRRQRVRFLVEEPEVVRDLVWGEGEPLAHYRVRGATRLLVRAEGSKRAVLLGLPRRPSRGERVTLASRRVIRGGFREAEEYCETWLERPTRRVTMTVRFPSGRPPREAELVTTPHRQPPRRVPIRYAADGRAYLRWGLIQPPTDRTYRLRWSW